MKRDLIREYLSFLQVEKVWRKTLGKAVKLDSRYSLKMSLSKSSRAQQVLLRQLSRWAVSLELKRLFLDTF